MNLFNLIFLHIILTFINLPYLPLTSLSLVIKPIFPKLYRNPLNSATLTTIITRILKVNKIKITKLLEQTCCNPKKNLNNTTTAMLTYSAYILNKNIKPDLNKKVLITKALTKSYKSTIITQTCYKSNQISVTYHTNLLKPYIISGQNDKK